MARQPATTCKACGAPRFHHRTYRGAYCREHLYAYLYRKKKEARHRRGVQPRAVQRVRREERERTTTLLREMLGGLIALREAVCMRDEGCKYASFKWRDRARESFRTRYIAESGFRARQRMRVIARKHGNPARQAAIEPSSRWVAIAAAADGTVTPEWVRAALESASTCPLCAHAFDWSQRWRTPSVDHMVPISRGGAHSVANLHIVCTSCNMAKGDRTLDEYEARPRRRADAEAA